MKRAILVSMLCMGAFALWARTPDSRAAETKAKKSGIDFNRDIRPIFSNHCYACHGPDSNKRKAALRLDKREDAFAKLKDGEHPLISGDRTKSAVFQRITAKDEKKRMPPKKTQKPLTPEEIETLGKWIDAGAKWDEHWSFIKPTHPPLPEVASKTWPKNGIDSFILAELEEKGLKPSPEADKNTLIRRVTFDLTGLPPTLQEIDEFQKDNSPNAYEKVVDRLLARPQYGERMAEHWLDLARYADTNGYHIDNHRSMWKYREWVISAFNKNKPFDEFTVEQLAGDLLTKPTLDQQIATGFNRNVMVNFEGGADPEEYLTKYVGDRVTTTATVWLGLTIACCECHDHKYDPLTQKDYYRLYAFYNNVPEQGLDGQQKNPVPSIKVPSDDQKIKQAELKEALAKLEAQFSAPEAKADEEQITWEKAYHDKLAALDKQNKEQEAPKLSTWHAVGPFIASSAEAAFSTEFGPEKDLDLTKTYLEGKLKWVEQPSWKDNEITHLTGDNAATYLYRTITSKTERKLALSLGSDDGIQVWLNGKKVHANNVFRAAAPDQDKVLVDLKAGENKLLLKINNGGGDYAFYFAIAPGAASEHPKNITDILALDLDKRNDAQKSELRNYYREKFAPVFKEIKTKIAEFKKKEADLDAAIPETMVMEDKPNLRSTHVLTRGDFRTKGDKVTAGVPQSMPQLPAGATADRLALARWLVSPEHPLTSRVTVNRYWQMFFGTGLVKTCNDFGTQGELPSHPELIDWLATEFIAKKWDVKAIQKMMVMSATYRQSSKVTPQLLEADPYNRLLTRGPRFRLSAEMIRDNALSVSGLLNSKIGGLSVFPYQPPGLWEEIAFGGGFSSQSYVQSKGADLYRRGLYTYVKRSMPNPSLAVFDAPNREVCTIIRPQTNTPLQALVLMNDTTFVEAARVLGQRVMKQGEDGNNLAKRLAFAFKLCTAREPNAQELEILEAIFNKQLEKYRKDPEAAKLLVGTGESPIPSEMNVSELAAWTALASVILNLDETITRG